MSKHHQDTKPLKVAVYARYSSDMQKDTSVEDQFATLEKAAKRLNLQLDQRHYYCDRAQSATTLFGRPGLTRDLLGAVERGEIEAVFVEATDRLSRSKADLFWLADRFEFHKVRIFTIGGEVSDMQLLFDGHTNSDFVKKLSIRVKRGHDRMAAAGRIPTCAAYGYDVATDHETAKRGLRVINLEEAAIVRRIFMEYASGMTPRQIVVGLERDKVPSPSGAPIWNYQTIVGGQGAKRGLLHNRLYIGEYVRNRFTAPKNPATGKRVVRPLDPDELMLVPMPALRIVSDELWNAAHAIRLKRQHEKFGVSGYVRHATVTRKQDLLSGLIVCASCSGLMSTIASSCRGGRRVACSNATQRKTCNHTKSYNVAQLTAGAIRYMHAHLTDPEFLKEKAKAKAQEAAKLSREESEERRKVENQLAKLDLQIKRLADAVADDIDTPVKELMEAIKGKEIERVALRERLKYLAAETNVTALHPANLTSFYKSVDTLHAKLLDNPHDPEARAAFQNIIHSVVVHPTPNGADYVIALYARFSAIMGGIDFFPAKRTAQEIVAAEGLPRSSGDGNGLSRPPSSRHSIGW
jgi:site-specific DNA recombinase